ncbi:glycosyltransferase family 4 protein [Sporofaciens sp. SGI.106]|uniref:glycosyltransferase family 4 protein n=1 Tax=Sporofaciens sp. SGI.106 TaxID=3420568 RepID=UPI003D08B080
MNRSKLTIIHIADIKISKFSGVSVVVPKHIKAQGQYANVGFINVNNIDIPDIEIQFEYSPGDIFKNATSIFKHPDLIVFHEVYHKEFLEISKQLRSKKIPYIIIPHGCLTYDALKQKWLKKTVANLLLFGAYINGARAIQCLSNAELNKTFKGKYKFIGTNGVTIPEIYKRDFSKDAIKLVYIGRLDPYHKGLDLLLQAIKQEEAYLKEYKCTFSFYGPYVKEWEDYIVNYILQNELTELVSLHREISGPNKEQELLSADIFIQTSRYEGMPLGILEALSYGIPCFITWGTTLGECVSSYDGGFVADTTVNSIAENFHTMVGERSNFKNKSENARLLVRDNFSWDLVAQETLAAYSGLIEE